MNQRAFYHGIVLALSSIVVVHAAEPARNHTITLDDFFTIATITQCSVSPDGKHVAYNDGRWQDDSQNRKTDLWVVSLHDRRTRRLTFDGAMSGSTIRWSADSRFIYFDGTRSRHGDTSPPFDGNWQVWRADLSGGELIPITSVAGGINVNGINSFDLSNEGRYLYYTTERTLPHDDWGTQLRKQFTSVNYHSAVSIKTMLHRLDLTTWRITDLYELDDAVLEFTISPDAARAAFVTVPDDNSQLSLDSSSKVKILDLSTNCLVTVPDEKWRVDGPTPYAEIARLAWSPDGNVLAFLIARQGYPNQLFLAAGLDGDLEVCEIQPPLGVNFRDDSTADFRMQWDRKDLLFLGDDRARSRIYRAKDVVMGLQPEFHAETVGEVVVQMFNLNASSRAIAAVLATPSSMYDVYQVTNGSVRRITQVNPQVDSWRLPQIKIVQWRSADGTEVEGVLELPPEQENAARLPVIVNLHGGPTQAWHEDLLYGWLGSVLFASNGYAFFSPNFRGSTGYGSKFITDLVAHTNDREIADILSGIESLWDKGVIDKDRVGVMGWSYGGYLTNCLVSDGGKRKIRFAAASSGAGIADRVTQWGLSDEPDLEEIFLKGLPWDKRRKYMATSPIFEFDKVSTPTIFHVGAADRRCPPGNSQMAYRALKIYGNVPTEFLVYPRAGHSLTEKEHRKAKMAWELAWFNRFLR